MTQLDEIRARDVRAGYIAKPPARSFQHEAVIDRRELLRLYDSLLADSARLREEVERLAGSLAACGVAAQCNTVESHDKHMLTDTNPYRTSSYNMVISCVRREMQLREEVERLTRERDTANELRNQYAGENKRLFAKNLAYKLWVEGK